MKYYLAIDIGASSGRHIIGCYDNNHNLIMEEIYRFKNSLKKCEDHLIWDIEEIFQEVKKGISVCLKKYPHIESMSIDTWGVDYVLMNNNQEIWPVFCYRDQRTKKIIEEVHNKISFDELYSITGSQFQEFNTIYQLYDDLKNNRLLNATDFLMIPEYLIYRLTGIKIKEYTNASTTGLLDSKTKTYSEKIISSLGFNKELFKPLSKPSTIVGDFSLDVQQEVGGNILVKLCSTHDTASAVEGIPMEENAPYISSGTWSLLGIKIKEPITNKEAQNANYSNEYGPNYIRFQKNIMGLWIIQNLAKQLNLSFVEMVKMAQQSLYEEVFDVNDECFLSTMDMKQEIINYFSLRKMILPRTNNDIINATFISLSHSYKESLDELEKITKQKYGNLYIVGGGAKNQYLNELTAKITKKRVIALPIEATARGNILSQMEDEE